MAPVGAGQVDSPAVPAGAAPAAGRVGRAVDREVAGRAVLAAPVPADREAPCPAVPTASPPADWTDWSRR